MRNIGSSKAVAACLLYRLKPGSSEGQLLHKGQGGRWDNMSGKGGLSSQVRGRIRSTDSNQSDPSL